MRVSATMKIQQLFPTTEVACDEDPTSFDACVLKKSSTVSPCHLPFLNYSSIPSDNMLPICQTPAEGYAAFQQFAPESDVGIDLSVEYRVAANA